MPSNKELQKYCDEYLNINSFKDFSPNGLQVEGRKKITNIISGVSANLALIKNAITKKADAIFVHHGFFWKGEKATITGAKRTKIKLLLANDINLFGYHLPLDAHPYVGNNIKLAQLLNITNPRPIDNSLVWQGNINYSLAELSALINKTLKRKPLIFGDYNKKIKKITWCTGGAQNYIETAIDNGADVYISGEISEQTPALAIENNIAYIAAGHHATERYGIQALCEHLHDVFKLNHQFIDIDNIV